MDDKYQNYKRNIKTNTKISRVTGSKTYKGYKYSNNSNSNFKFKNKFLLQCLIVCVFLACFYSFSKSNSNFSDNIIEKTKIILNKNINIEQLTKKFKALKNKVDFLPNIVKGSQGNISIDEDELLKMDENSNIKN